MDLIKKWDVYGKPVTFYYSSSTVHKTFFGGVLSLISFSLMMTITITSLINFLYQKPVINSNIVFFINKKFTQLEGMEIKGKLILENKESIGQLDDFIKYYRIVLHEKYYNELENYQVANIAKVGVNNYQFNVKMSISDVFKEKEISSLKIMSCEEIMKNPNMGWESRENATTCDINYQKYFNKDYKYDSYLFSFDTPIYTVDRKGTLHKVPHQNELRFKVTQNKNVVYAMDTKYVVIEDDSNIYYTHKKYDAYFTMKRPNHIEEKDREKDYSLEIQLQNESNDQMVLITIYKYKLLDFLAKLGGIMKIITFVKMTGKFWSSFFYEQTLYNLLVKRKNPYLEQKKELLETSIYRNSTKLKKADTPEGGEQTSIIKKELNSTAGPFDLGDYSRNKKSNPTMNYASYCSWFLNRFCKSWYSNKEAKQKRLMLSDTLGLNNYLLHLDYIDRQIILEQQTGEIEKKIKDVINRNKGGVPLVDVNENENIQEVVGHERDLKGTDNTLIDIQNENNLNKPLTFQEK